MLWRMAILKVRDDFHYLIFDMHHSVFDGWSLHAFLTELNNTYLELKSHNHCVIENLSCSYRDHIIGEIADINNTSSIDFWRDELKDYNRFKFSRIGQQHQYITKYFPMDSELKDELRALATKLDSSIKDLCFSAYLITMGMLSHNDDFVVGCTTNN